MVLMLKTLVHQQQEHWLFRISSASAAAYGKCLAATLLPLLQVELTARLENERLEARVADLTATKQSLEQQLAASKQEVTRLSREASEARVQAEEARVGRQLLQTQLEEANSHLKQLQGVIDKYSGGTKGVSLQSSTALPGRELEHQVHAYCMMSGSLFRASNQSC